MTRTAPIALTAPVVRGRDRELAIIGETLELLDTGHFAWEDGAEEWGSVALDWIQGGYRLATGVSSE